MKAKEIIEVLTDLEVASAEAMSKWTSRLEESVYSEIAICLKYSSKEDIERFSKSIASFVIGCYDKDVIELVLKLANTPHEHLILDSIERFKKEEKK